MPLRSQAICLAQSLNKVRTVKFFFLFSCTSLAFVILLAQFATNPIAPTNLFKEAIHNVGQDLRYTDVYRNTKHLPKHLKYILLWTDRTYSPFSFLEDGQRSFLKHNCSTINCYISADKYLFGSDYTKFDAIAFNGRNMKSYRLPRRRSIKQKYIFFNLESADNYPGCNAKYDGYFNLTATYRLDSDILLTYIIIRNRKGEIVGPKPNMPWIKNMRKIDKQYRYGDKIRNKSKIAAWFVSNCNTRSNREDFVKALNDALKHYGYNIDIYGSCGYLKCSTDGKFNCDFLLKRDYFFYLALENSFAEDYVTEKLLTALHNDVVPIVYGGADYSRFLPPGSYIDGRRYSIYELAATMDRLAHSPRAYREFFKWKTYYTYDGPSFNENVCRICEGLNDNNLMNKVTTYEKFRYWWNPDYRNRCKWYYHSVID